MGPPLRCRGLMLVALLMWVQCGDVAVATDVAKIHSAVLAAYGKAPSALETVTRRAWNMTEASADGAAGTVAVITPAAAGTAGDIGSTGVTEIGTGMRSYLTARTRAKVLSTQREGLQSCALRLHTDIADGIVAEVEDQMETGLVSLLIDGIVIVVCLIVVIVTVIFLLSTLDQSGSTIVKQFCMTINPAVMAVVWPLMENDAVINLVDESTTALMNSVSSKLRYRLTVTIGNYLTDVVSKALYVYIMEEELPVLAAGVAHRVLHAVTLDLTRSLTRSLTHTIPRYVRGVLSKNTVRLFYCVYCYREGQFCTYCFSWQSFGDPQKTKSMEPDMFMVKTE